jgi:cytochrome c biogenesis protein CcmG/thiol:disulfide interchange protein DsbE
VTSAQETSGLPPARPRLRPLLLVPLVVFAGLAAVFLGRLVAGGDPSLVPSALIGRPAPEFTLPPLDGMNVPALSRADFDGRVTLVNIFASWCAPCRAEHPILTALAADERVRVVGINYKDTPDNARRFLRELGNPFAAIGVDERGRSSLDWGVYGVPETFLVGPDGVIRAKVIGPLTPDNVAAVLAPAVEKALAPAR